MTAQELIDMRARFHWSQIEAAKALGCSEKSISNWENGANAIPKSIALAASAVAMNLPPYGFQQRLVDAAHQLSSMSKISINSSSDSPSR